MQANQLQNCCGIILLSEFGNTKTAIDQTEYTSEQVKEFIQRQILYNKGGETYGRSMLMTTLNKDQLDKLGSIFVELGFDIITENYHKNHGSIIYVLVKKL